MGARLCSESIRVAILAASMSLIDLTAQKSGQSENASRKVSHQYRVCTVGAVRLYASELWCKRVRGPALQDGVIREPPGMDGERCEENRLVDRLSDSVRAILFDESLRVLIVPNSLFIRGSNIAFCKTFTFPIAICPNS